MGTYLVIVTDGMGREVKRCRLKARTRQVAERKAINLYIQGLQASARRIEAHDLLTRNTPTFKTFNRDGEEINVTIPGSEDTQ